MCIFSQYSHLVIPDRKKSLSYFLEWNRSKKQNSNLSVDDGISDGIDVAKRSEHPSP
jgi:hypothetical protein